MIEPVERDDPLLPAKAELVSRAIERYAIRSLIDAGACWGVNGGYTFHALKFPTVEKAFILDGQITQRTRERAAGEPRLRLIQGNIATAELIAQLPHCDAVIMFDVLLHQVKPDWYEMLANYAGKVDYFIIWNQDWVGGDTTIRFVDYPHDWYHRHIVPHRDELEVMQWYGHHGHMHPNGRLERDNQIYWQWGIVNNDLISTMHRLGFQLDYFDNHGPYADIIPLIHVDAYLFRRRGAIV